MATRIYNNDFSLVFSKLLEKTGISCYQIQNFTHIDQAYLSRLRNGEKDNPSPEIIVKICLACVHLSRNVTLYDIEKLLNTLGRSINLR